MTQEVTMMRDAAIRNMAAMPPAKRLEHLAKLLAVAQAERRKAERTELFFLHSELLRIHNELVCSEQHKIAQAKQREEERKQWQLEADRRWSESTQPERPYTPPPAAPKPQYDPTFHREQQRGMLAFGMVVGGVMAVVVALHIAPVATASLIGGVILLRYLMAEKPDRDAHTPGTSQHIHYHNHYHNTQNIHEK